MGLFRDVLERSAEGARQLRSQLAVASPTNTPAATPSMTPGEDTPTPHHQEVKKPASGVAAARLTQLVGDNPPPGSLARVIRRKYQSVARERERIAMVSAASSSTSNPAGMQSPSASRSSFGTDARSDAHNELRDAIEQYEVEFPRLQDTTLGIELETDFYGKHTVVKSVRRGSTAFAVHELGFMRSGHVVVGVNGQDLSQMNFEQVLHTIKQAAGSTRVIRFVDPSVLPMKLFKFEPSLVNRDQYGFAKDDKYILSYRKQLRKQKSMSYPHEKKWTEFVQRSGGLDALDEWMGEHSSDSGSPDTAKALELRTLVQSGVPAVLRPRIWSILAGVTKYKKKFGARYFEELVSEQDTSPSAADIEKDICRTYPEHPFFQTEKGKTELKNVLCAYSLHNPSVGYCQSMNFIAGMLLLFMAEDDAFWLLCVMLHKRYLPVENYSQSMLGTQTDQLVFKWLVESELPELAARLESSGIQIQLVTLHWFLCAFVCTLPTETALRVWDWFFLDGEQVLFAVAIGILKLAERQVLSAATHSDVHNVVRGLGTDLHDEDAFMCFLLSAQANAGESVACAHPVRSGPAPLIDSPSKVSASRTASAPALVSPRFASPDISKEKKSASRMTTSKFLQQLFLPDSPRGDIRTHAPPASSSPVFSTKLTMREIEQKRAEVREQIESKTAPSPFK